MPENAELDVFYKLCTTLMEEGTEKYSKIAYLITNDMALAACSLWNKNENSLLRVGYYHSKQDNSQWLQKLDYKIAKTVVDTGREFLQSSVDSLIEKSAAQLVEKPGIGVVALPIIYNDKALGVANFWVAHNYSNDFSNYLARELVQQIAADFFRVLHVKEDNNKYVQFVSQYRKQLEFEPKVPTVTGLSIAARSAINRNECGCLYEFFPGDNLLSLGFAEVNGDIVNIPAFKLAVKLVMNTLSMDKLLPNDLLNKLNHIMFQDLTRSGYLLAQFFGTFDLQKRTFIYANGGHIPPLMVARDSGKVQKLMTTGPLLGMEQKAQFTSTKVELKPGDIFVFYSRGIIETVNQESESYNNDRIMDLISRYKFYDAHSLVDYIYMDYHQFLGQRKAEEDMLIIVVKVEG